MRHIEVFTIGHSHHAVEHFIRLLKQHAIEHLADVRRFPSSRRFPQFNQRELATSLVASGIGYRWLEALGGHRDKSMPDSESPNLGIRDESFRNYADYMLTEEFREGVGTLTGIAGGHLVAMMCAEASCSQCHRQLVSDYLVASGVRVQHILPDGECRPHRVTRGAEARHARVTYPERLPLFDVRPHRGRLQ